MGLIRNQNAAALTRNAVVLDLSDIAGQAEEIRTRAKADAEQIVIDARQLARKLSSSGNDLGYREGLDRGHREGMKIGLAEGRAEAQQAMAESIELGMRAWTLALTDFQGRRERLQQEARQDVLRLALDIGERVVYRVIETDETTIRDQLSATLRLLATRTAVVVQLNPADLEMAQKIMPSLVAEFDHCDDMTLVADDAITRGGCLVRTGTGAIDAQIETQVRRIMDTLLPPGNNPVHDERIAPGAMHAPEPSDADVGKGSSVIGAPSPPTITDEEAGSEGSVVDSFLSSEDDPVTPESPSENDKDRDDDQIDGAAE